MAETKHSLALASPAEHLSPSERRRLSALESIIRKGVETFYDVGSALREIRESKLYRQQFDTFENYCDSRWGFQASRARQLIGSADVVDNLKSVTTVTPANERQVRELAALPPEKQKVVWQAVIKTTRTEKITAQSITTVIQDLGFAPNRWGERATASNYTDYLEALERLTAPQLEVVLRKCLSSIPSRNLFAAVDDARYMTSEELSEFNHRPWERFLKAA